MYIEFVCCYSSRLVVYLPSISSIVLYSKFYRTECTCSPSMMMFFYLVTWGWNFTSAYVRIQSIHIRRHMERRHVNREECRE